MRESGQTLIETLVGLAVLVTGVIAGLSLAIYSFSSISAAVASDVGSGLAREGVEVSRRLRDSNWLSGTLADCGGYFCISTWLTSPYTLTGSTGLGTEYRAIFDRTATGNKWTLSAAPPGADFRLYVQSDGVYTHTVTTTPSPYYRKVVIIYASTASPYDATSPLVLIRSTVWWTDRRCPNVSDPAVANSNCKIVSEAYLANWKNF